MYLTVKQAAQRLNYCTKTVYNLMKRGELPYIKLGTRSIRIDEDEIARLMERNKVISGAGPKYPL